MLIKLTRFVTQFMLIEPNFFDYARRMADTPTDLYRHFDKDGQLLYVGISFRAIIRQAAHRDKAPWWGDVASITVEKFPSRAAARAAEKKAIQEERPLHNNHWNKKKFRYEAQYSKGHTIELPGAPEMAAVVADWYIALTRSPRLPKALKDLADKFDESTDAGRGYAYAIRALEQMHADAKKEAKKAPKPKSDGTVRKALRKLGRKPGPPTLLDTIDKNELKRLRKDLGDPKMSWRKLKDKYGYAVATLRRHFEEERKEALLKLAEEDEQ